MAVKIFVICILGANVIKLFTSVIYQSLEEVIAFVTGPFKLSLIIGVCQGNTLTYYKNSDYGHKNVLQHWPWCKFCILLNLG